MKSRAKDEYTLSRGKHNNNGLYERIFKRFMDFSLSIIAIIIFSPLLIIVAILVRFKLGSPVLFKQKRPGLNEKIFTMYKFRTMTEENDKNGNKLPDNARLTKFGRMLRSTSLDELPELFNIVKGDMSIVGPRPQLVRDLVFMTSVQRKRHMIRPGLTGWAQVNGRNNVTWEEKLSLDLYYLNNVKLIFDLKIILKTLSKVLRKEDVSTEGLETSEDLGDYMLRIGKVDIKQYKENQELCTKLLERS